MTQTAKEVLLDHIPKNCWWEEMENLTNTPFRYVEAAMNEYAHQQARSFANWLSNEVIAGLTIEKLWSDYKERIS